MDNNENIMTTRTDKIRVIAEDMYPCLTENDVYNLVMNQLVFNISIQSEEDIEAMYQEIVADA